MNLKETKKLSFKKTLSILLLLLVVGSFTFLYYSSTFNVQNLKAIDIHLTNSYAILENGTPEYFLLSPENRAKITLALASVKKTDLRPQQITYQYNMILHNSWGFSREYTVLFTEDAAVLLQDHQENGSLYKVGEPNFFYSHEGFRNIYSDRLTPALQVSLNGDQVPFSKTGEHWSYLRYDGQWILEDFDLGRDAVNNGNVIINSSEDTFVVQTDKPPDYSYLKVVDPATDKIVFEKEADLSQLPFPDTNGRYNYELSLGWSDETKYYRGEAVINIPVLIDRPEKFIFSKQRLIQGDMLEVSVFHAEDPEDIFFEQSIYSDFRWYSQEGLIRGYIPTNYNTEPGRYQIKYGNRKEGTEFAQEIEVVAHNYRIQHLTIDEQVDKDTRNDAAYDEFAKHFTPIRKQSEPDRYYTESFVLPAKGRLTTEFGQTRYVNGAPTSSRHSGLDIAAPTGTEIKATNRGKVVLAMPLILTGNTIVIDHGEGLFSVYYHMHESIVTVGETVERGQKIGTIGTTGFSTGPHLHFILSYYTMNLEPGFLLVGQPITFANYLEFIQQN